MAKRGKEIGWTPEQDVIVFKGGSVEGRTPQENANRRYKLRTFFKRRTAVLGLELCVRLETLQAMGSSPKAFTPALLEKLKTAFREMKE